jgi:protein tyrosine phosphatase (PTP) superfamily phosphohydrolase (DUF442 family)
VSAKQSVNWHIPFAFTRISDRFLAGSSPLTGDDLDTLLLQGITDILDLRRSVEYLGAPCYYQGDACGVRGIRRHHVPLCDDEPPTCAELDAAIEKVQQVLADSERVLFMHCRAGVDRAGTVLVAWFALEHDLTFGEALAILREKRAMLAPTFDQEWAVRRWLKARA